MARISRHELELRIHGYAEMPSRGEAVIRSFDRPARIRRALGLAGIIWVATLAGVFIPVAHFIIVPLGTALGFYFLLMRLREEASTERCSGICPDCGIEQDFEIGAWFPPVKTQCAACGRGLMIAVEGDDTTNPYSGNRSAQNRM